MHEMRDQGRIPCSVRIHPDTVAAYDSLRIQIASVVIDDDDLPTEPLLMAANHTMHGLLVIEDHKLPPDMVVFLDNDGLPICCLDGRPPLHPSEWV